MCWRSVSDAFSGAKYQRDAHFDCASHFDVLPRIGNGTGSLEPFAPCRINPAAETAGVESHSELQKIPAAYRLFIRLCSTEFLDELSARISHRYETLCQWFEEGSPNRLLWPGFCLNADRVR